MNLRTLFGLTVLLNAAALSAQAADLSVNVNVTPDNGLYKYDYIFTVSDHTGGANLDNIYLTSDDLSPVNGISFLKDNAPTTDWLWLGNDTPYNYLQFFSQTDTLKDSDSLEVLFDSTLAPRNTHFAFGYDSSTGLSTSPVTGIAGPSVPEPGALASFGGLLVLGIAVRRKRRAC